MKKYSNPIDQITFEKLYPLLGKTTKDKEVAELISQCREMTDIFEYLEYSEENIMRPNDNSVCIDGYPIAGIVLEISSGILACISFQLVDGRIDGWRKCSSYKGVIRDGVREGFKKKNIHDFYGKPLKSRDKIEQYHLPDEIIMGIIYGSLKDGITPDTPIVISYGSKKVFSDPKYFPNRFSLIFNSLYDLPVDN